MANATGEEFVTIVPVGESRPAAAAAATVAAANDSVVTSTTGQSDSTYVTVLTLGVAAGAAEIAVRRPRGARLGLGLKFEGGSAAVENVRRLLVQSCAEGSPAALATTPWGKLIPGDEILAIDGVSVSELTRIECVRRLKDSDETLTLLVKHLEQEDVIEKTLDVTDSISNPKQTFDSITRPTALPPPVPPRKLGKKSSFKEKSILQTVGEQNGVVNNDIKENGQNVGVSANLNNKLSRKSSFDSHLLRQKDSIACLKRGSPEEVRRLVRRLSDGKSMPPEAEVYIDLLSTEWERCLALADAESDDTGSSISTVVDRLGSMTSSVENSIPSTPILQPKTIDIQKVLNCIENIDCDILKDINSSRYIEKRTELKENNIPDKTIVNNVVDNKLTSFITHELVQNTKKPVQNDKNNNNSSARNVTCVNLEVNDYPVRNNMELKLDMITEKPKPMPRNSKLENQEKKLKSHPTVDSAPQVLTEPLLTPTKKNCIETWLQRSEAEMSERVEEDSVPEALPRLIDFVPKPQFKETETPTALARPTSAPPPPPPLAEPREDGSGASLDTIGELDEPSDVVDHQKTHVVERDTKQRKASYESGFWEDRVNKSDAEDKSLSNDEALPTCPRQPPDGVETPSDVVEKMDIMPSRLPPRLHPVWPTTKPRYSFISRSQDARSEASVKDKIAMFSNEQSTSTEVHDKCGTLPLKNSTSSRQRAYVNLYSDVSSLDRRLTKSQDNLDEVPRSYRRQTERPEVLGAFRNITTVNKALPKSNAPTIQDKNKPLFYGSTTTLPTTIMDSYNPTIVHSRSSSEDSASSVHKSNLEYLIEQRKKSMSKLRGLVIPEAHQTPIVDLPEIKILDPIAKSYVFSSNKCNTVQKHQKQNKPRISNLSEQKWKTDLMSNNLPKYSPAFKRKSLQVYSPTLLTKEPTPEKKIVNSTVTLGKNIRQTIPSKPPRTSLDTKVTSDLSTSSLLSKFTLSNSQGMQPKDTLNELRNYNNVEIKICTATDIVDSDNDSAMSSTQSSYRSSASSPLHNLDSIESDSSRFSPRICHITSCTLMKSNNPTKSSSIEKNCEEFLKRSVCRSMSSDTNVSLSSSAGSAATSGSQASCSSLESSVADSERKNGKSNDIDTINRRNILASAKCRSGRDAKLNSPVIETKFSHESYHNISSPQLKTSDRLSTLTSSVSAISNKGDTRRRNKLIAETDSDTDDEINVRQRKNEYKNTRLKRNSSTSNKTNKQIETKSDTAKIDDAPKVISERIIQEIKKAGLDNFNTIKTKSLIENSNIDLRSDTSLIKKEDKLIKKEISPKLKSDKSISNITGNLFINEKSKAVETSKQPVTNGKVKLLVEDSKGPTRLIRLRRGAGTGVGLILAGGTDCEAKEVTVHRVLSDSVADRAGLKRGARVRSINGCTMTGLTHAQSVAILKEQRLEVVIEIEDERNINDRGTGCGSDKADSKAQIESKRAEASGRSPTARPVVTVYVEKAGGGAGLGFGLDGGRDSPQGDRPLTIKKLFAGGAASKSGRIIVGAELLSAGGQSMEGYTRTQAWAALKALPAGPVALVLRNPTHTESEPLKM